MIPRRICCLLTPGTVLPFHSTSPRFLTTTNALGLIQKWRKERGLPLNPNRTGVLTDAPDYTFLDGRLTPCGMRQKERILKQREVTRDIIRLTEEVDFAVERHKQLQIAEAKRKQDMLDKKLKPKGLKLLKSK